MRKIILGLVLVLGLSVLGQAPVVLADAAPGDTIIVLGEDLTISQREDILREMGVEDPDSAQITTVSNADEHKYLGDYIPAAQIGTRAISSAIILIGEKGDGLSLETNNITYVSDQMYGNALSTAGVKDAEIYITAPFGVSGTGALTGIIQAYEISSGVEINEENKKVANEEMVLTSDLAENETMSQDDAAEFMSTIKKEIGEAGKLTKEELEEMIKEIARDNGFDLTAEEISRLVDLFRKFQEIDIDWSVINQTVGSLKNQVTDFIDSDEGQGFMAKMKAFFASIVDFFKTLFGGTDSTPNNVNDVNNEPVQENTEKETDPVEEEEENKQTDVEVNEEKQESETGETNKQDEQQKQDDQNQTESSDEQTEKNTTPVEKDDTEGTDQSETNQQDDTQTNDKQQQSENATEESSTEKQTDENSQ